jgi:homoserine kinase
MRKVKISLPATITNVGPGLNSLGLAVGLRATVEIRERSDEQLVIEIDGEGAKRYTPSVRHPVMLGLVRVFQALERAPLGFSLKIESQIPSSVGLGSTAAFTIAGVIAANNLMGTPFNRDQALALAAKANGRADGVVTAMLGGLTASTQEDDGLLYRTLPVASLQVVVVAPELDTYADDARLALPDRIDLADAQRNLSRMPLMIEALRNGDYKLLARAGEDAIRAPLLRPHIPGYGHVVEMARRGGAAAVMLSGDGPALVAFAEKDHSKIAQAMVTAFSNSGVKARSWVLPVDTQGVVVSVVMSV